MPRSIAAIKKSLTAAVGYAADVDACLSSLQRLEIGGPLRQDIRALRVQFARLTDRIVERIDPDHVADVPLDALVGLPFSIDEADGGYGVETL